MSDVRPILPTDKRCRNPRRAFLATLAAGVALTLAPRPSPATPPTRADQGLLELRRWARVRLNAADPLAADVAAVVLGSAIMSLAVVESHGSPAQAREGRALYHRVRARCSTVLGREPTLSDVLAAPLPASAEVTS